MRARWSWLALALVVGAGLWQPRDPYAVSPSDSFAPPSSRFWFGADRLGRDVFSRCTLALRNAVVEAGLAEAAAAAASLATAAGVLALARRSPAAADAARSVLLAARMLPSLLVALTIGVVFRRTAWGGWLALFVVSYVYAVPFFEAELGSAMRRPEIEGARALGASRVWILRHYLIPTVGTRLARYAWLDFAGLVAYQSVMGFVGLTRPPHPMIGEMIFEARPYMLERPWLFWAPTGLLAVALATFWKGLPSRPNQEM